MKRLIKVESKCIRCGNCETTCSKAFFKEANRDKSCIKVRQGDNGYVSITICTQCGECAAVCNTEVIKKDKNGVYRINKKECVGCLMCVGFCPEGAMMQNDEFIEPFKCIACGLCVKNCPTGAIKIEEYEE